MRKTTNNRPNILFIMTDQHSHDFTGFSGNTFVHTPNLDDLASKSTVFFNTYCQNPLCVPSRSSLLSGQYSRNIGVYENTDIFSSEIMTLPAVLADNGYRTCLIGKAHFNGKDQYHGYAERPYGDLRGQGHQPDPRRDDSPSGLGNMVKNSGESKIPLPMTQTEICVSETVKWLQLHRMKYPNRPFMLSVNFDKPHFPFRAPSKYLQHYEGKINYEEIFPYEHKKRKHVPFVELAVKRYGGFDRDTEQRALEAYCACVEWIDDAIGRIMATIEYLGFTDNTVVIYTSDHGELAGRYGAWNKSLFFDACNKVPLLIKLPNQSIANYCTSLTGLIDIFPTCCELAEISVPDYCDGVSLVPLLSGKDEKLREYIFSESAFLGDPQHAGCMIRKEEWKYNYYLDGTEELYNLAKDMHELNNLANKSDFSSLKNELKQKVIEFWEPEKQQMRIKNTPKVNQHKHCYPFSNQFVNPDGTVFDAVP